MLTYWLMYFTAAFAAINSAGKWTRSGMAVWTLVGTVLTVIIGLRHHVGGDWNNYLWNFNKLQYLSFEQVMVHKDPGYQWISYLVSDLGWGGMYLVNFLCALLFVSGLIALLRRQPNPWLGLTVAIPYLIIVVSMGYTRQAAAIGLVMWGLAALDRGKFARFIVFSFLAITFHKTAILMMAFGIFQQGKGKLVKVLALALVGVGIWSAFVEQASSALWKHYVEAEMESQGAMVRVLLNFVPAVLLLVFRKQWKENFNDYGLWFMIAIASIISVWLVGYASTAVDRIALYFIPIQIVVFARLPFLARRKIAPKTTAILVVLFYALVMFVWLNFAANARYWVPYHNVIFMDL